MRILFLTQVLPYPLDAGPKTRSYHVLRHLASRGHRITLLSFVRDSDRPEYLDHLRQWCERVETVKIQRSQLQDIRHLLASLGDETPFLIRRDFRPEMEARLKRLLCNGSRYDAVHADQLWMAPYALLAREAVQTRARMKLVLDQHNAVFQIPHRLAEAEANPIKRFILQMEARKMARYERKICRRFDCVAWVSSEDLNAVRNGDSVVEFSHARGIVIPICVDPAQQPALEAHENASRITFLGGLHWPPNLEGVFWFLKRVWPKICASIPSSRLTIIGKNPPRKLERFLARSSRAEVTGYVGDLDPYLRETAVFIVPLLSGGGMRVKILDAWCRGLPVVTTTVGAEGLHLEHDLNLVQADTPEEFAEGVVRVFKNTRLALQLRRMGRSTVEEHYDWRKIYPSWDKLYP